MGDDQLPGWRETPAKQAIVEFVAAVTNPGSADFVAEAERIAVFDNDGTLWTEQPVYAQLAFALDRAAELGHPSGSTPTTVTPSWAAAPSRYSLPPPSTSGP